MPIPRSPWLLIALVAAVPAGIAAGAETIRFNTNFEGGSLGKIETLGEGSFRLHVRGQQDEQGRNRQANWYFFRMENVRGRELSITMTDFVGEYNFRPGAVAMGPEITPVWSVDGKRWQPVPSMSWDDRAKEATIRLQPDVDTIWLAHQPPYTHSRLLRLLEEVGRSDDVRVEVIGKTARGRDLHLVTITDATVSDRDKRCVWLQARQHAWESGTSYVMEGALRFASSSEPAARELRRKVVFKFTPMADPDGSAEGNVRFNANGYDVNRHWDEVDLRDKRMLARMPEIWYVKKSIYACIDSGRPIDLLLNMHNTETNEYLQTMAGDPRSRALISSLSDRLKAETSFRPSRGPDFAAARDSSAIVLHAERGVVVVLMEQRVSKDPQTGLPPTPDGRLEFGAKLIQIMGEVALTDR
jgi:hypothetical protein